MEKEYEQIVRTPFALRQVKLLYGRYPFRSAFFCEETRKRYVEVGKNAKKVRKVGKLVLNAYVRSREVNPKALSFF